MPQAVYQAERIFDGRVWHDDAALVVEDGRVARIGRAEGGERLPGWIVPGLIDLQVNGGGGVLLNDAPTVEGIAAICAAHAAFGTTSTMATLITDAPAVTTAAIAAAERAGAVPGYLGLHLEGPHLALSRKGTHDPARIRAMGGADLAQLCRAAAVIPHLICTLAPESVTLGQVAILAAAGAVVSLGHTDCDRATAVAYADAGARMVTHLFNAMSQMSHRAPGLVGAGLDEARLWCGLIADGFHVGDTALRVALRAKPQEMFLVSDAMSTVGTDLTGITLNGRQIYRAGGRLTLADGTLAGADIAVLDAVRHVHLALGWPLEVSLRLASAHPAAAMGIADRGHLRPGARADFFCLTPEVTAAGTWIGGQKVAGP